MGGDIEMAGMVMGAPRQAAQTAGVSLSVLITAEGEQKKGIWKGEIQEGLIMVANKCTGEWHSADYEQNQELQSLLRPIFHQRAQK